MKDNSKLIAIVLVIITIIVVITSLIFNKEEVDEPDINIVTNYSDFYTVSSCLNRVVTYLSSKDTNSLMLVLQDNYKKENNITENNILEVFDSIEIDSSFISKKMYYQVLNNNITKYYVYGNISKNQLFDDQVYTKLEVKDIFFIVYLDKNNKTFSIEPYLGNIFMDGDIDE